jgi:GR25 family glycosyltransferase involved in LPS biosynthesis
MKLNNFYDRIFVIHWKPLKERKEYLLNKFKELDISEKVEWVEQYETERDLLKENNPFNINSKILAVNLSHIFCYKEQLRKKYKNILIFEDDVDFGYIDVIKYLNQAAEEFENLDGDMAFLSTCCGLKVEKINPPQLLYYDASYVTRCCGAYIVNERCVDKLIKSVLNLHAIDRVLNAVIPLLNIRCLWSGLPLRQGSETGKYKSVLIQIRDENGNYINEQPI